eukprot:NODE_3077_length_820_cov_139.941634_g2559_i0.p1 GENE.NODE_3077_length_820_cov_139.941634_g2559_i0~~NODE_3077_length_820_cov_139.941634_g2559_i0.p1  ORF type:complete len:199 (-),score=33.70 NODE_3077_length_820_cov_139.941634_g2559_i0:86-682(-)
MRSEMTAMRHEAAEQKASVVALHEKIAHLEECVGSKDEPSSTGKLSFTWSPPDPSLEICTVEALQTVRKTGGNKVWSTVVAKEPLQPGQTCRLKFTRIGSCCVSVGVARGLRQPAKNDDIVDLGGIFMKDIGAAYGPGRSSLQGIRYRAGDVVSLEVNDNTLRVSCNEAEATYALPNGHSNWFPAASMYLVDDSVQLL